MMTTHLPAFRTLLLFVFCLTGTLGLFAQDFRIDQNSLVITCAGNFVDAGGQTGPHSVGTEQTITICSDSPAPNSHVRVTFTQFQIEGTMDVYNDDNADDPNDIITTYDNTANGTFPIVTATAANVGGCLTFVFNGTAANNPGWIGAISCERACQPVIAALFQSDPEVMPVDTGYIDVCLGEPVLFIGGGIYPEDGAIYDQDDATSTLEWNFTDGFTSDNDTVIRTFEVAGGYIVNLDIVDVQGCTNTNQIRQRIRVAPRPRFNLQTDFVTEVCASDTIVLAGSTEINPNPDSEIFVDSDEVGFPVGLAFADTTFLPDDGNGQYETPLEFTNFSPGATLTDVNDLLGICLNMEHSYVGDLDIWIECPNGQEAYFIEYPNGQGSRYFGEPVDVDADLSPGIGYDYCWAPNQPQTLDEYGDAIGLGGGESFPADTFAPVQSFDNLLGCPLNGEWTIHVADNLFSDNGYIFSWSIQFADYLYPGAERFRVGIEDNYWEQLDNMIYYDPDSIRALATFSGINAYTYTVIDSFACEYDTTLTVEVIPYSSPDCYSCQPMLDTMEQTATVCAGSDLQTTLATRENLDTVIAWADFPYTSFTNLEYPNLSGSLNSTIPVNNIRPLNITDANYTIESVCVNIDTEEAGDIRLFLQTPAGSLLELSTGNGSGPNYTNTCFTPTATVAITDGTAPFTGNYLPEADFTFLNGTAINGDWTLRAYDVAGGAAQGEFKDWSISFRHENDITYSWTPDDGSLSCTDCPNPVITVNADQVYTVTATDEYNCTESGMVNITLGSLPANIMVLSTNPDCGQAAGSATVDVDPNAGYGFAWSHGPTTQTVDNLPPGMYTVTISAGNCETTRDVTITGSPAIEASIVSVDSVSCNGASDGRIEVESSGGAGMLSYAWDDPNLQVLEDAVFLTAGTYTLIITDENNCMDTLTATVEEPAALDVSFTTDDVACNGGSDGTASVMPTGGTGSYSYSWETGAQSAQISDVPAGNYAVTVTDVNGCQIVDSVTVSQPAAAVSLTIAQDQMGCAGASLNVATVNAMGGQAPYVYAWPNGASGPTADSLSSGLNTVSVTDGSGCTTSIDIDLQDLQPISFNLFVTPPSCNGSSNGAMGVNQLTGGAGSVDSDYTFNWSSGSNDIVADNLVGGVEYSLTVTDQLGCTAVESRFLEEPAPLVLSTTSSPVTCAGDGDGTISIVSISGPNPGAYTIQWDAAAGGVQDSTVTGLEAGTYTVEITDSRGCIATRSVAITEPTALSLELNHVDVTCFGDTDGRITTSVNGGVPDYTFNWSNGSNNASLTDLSTGTYDLQLIDANGCEINEQVRIDAPPEVVATATADDVICNGDATGAIQIMGSGGRPPFTYGLDNTGFSQNALFIGLLADDYTVYVRDAGGCLGTTQVIVEDGPEFIVDLGEDQDIVFGDSIDLSPVVEGAAGTTTFFWSGSYDGTLLCAGDSISREQGSVVICPVPNAKPEYEIDYRVLVIDENGCEAEDRVRVRVEKVRVVEVPAAFTPNNDGQNDRLIVHGRPGTTIQRFSVFDRWGELVYEDADFPVNDLGRGWDGNYKNEPVMGGVFLWQVLVTYEDGSEELLTGQTSLLR